MTRPESTIAPETTPEPAAGTTGDPQAAILSLAWVEGRRLVRHPVVLAAVLLVLLIWVVPLITGSANRFPVLYYSSFEISLQQLPIALAALIATNLAMLRSYRHGADIFYDVTPLPGWQRTLAHLLSVLPLAVLTGLLGLARLIQLALLPGAIGRPHLLELAAAPAVTILFGVLGVLLGRLVRSTVIAPMLLAFLTFTYLFGFIDLVSQRLQWLGPLVLSTSGSNSDPDGGAWPADLLDRPAGVHLIYLAALGILLGTAALLRSSAPRLPVALVAAGAALTAAITGVLQVAPPSADVVARRLTAQNAPAAIQHCQLRNNVTYCTFSDFRARAADWDRIVDDVRRRVPRPQADQPFTVRQRVMAAVERTSRGGMTWHPNVVNDSWAADDKRANTPNPVPVGMAWGHPREEIAFAARVAHRLITGSEVTTEENYLLCGGMGVLTLWLAGQTTRQAPDSLAEQAASNSGRALDINPVSLGPMLLIGRREVEVTIASLGQPTDRVAGIVARSWPELTSSKTTVERAAEILGVSAPAKLPAVPVGEESTFGDCG